MSIGYLGYLKLANYFLLTNSTGLNRQVNPLQSTGVWGAGWYNASSLVAYADSQQHFEGAIDFDLQGMAGVWNLVRNWLIEERCTPQSVIMSPNGIVVYDYSVVGGDNRTGVWGSQCGFEISSEAIVKANVTGMALERTETVGSDGYCANYRGPGPGIPTGPLNPAPRNTNPIPGWYCQAQVTWPSAPAFWSDPGNQTGMVLRSASVTLNNNTQVIRGCTATQGPVAIIQGSITADGSMVLWKDGGIPDPYGTLGTFTASGANVTLNIAPTGPNFTFELPYVLITSDAYDVKGQNEPVTRTFGIAGVGDGINPPLLMSAA